MRANSRIAEGYRRGSLRNTPPPARLWARGTKDCSEPQCHRWKRRGAGISSLRGFLLTERGPDVGNRLLPEKPPPSMAVAPTPPNDCLAHPSTSHAARYQAPRAGSLPPLQPLQRGATPAAPRFTSDMTATSLSTAPAVFYAGLLRLWQFPKAFASAINVNRMKGKTPPLGHTFPSE